MNVVDDFIVIVYVRNDADVEVVLVGVHVRANVVHGEIDRLLYLLEVLQLLDLVVRELVLSRYEYALISEQLLALLFSNDLFRTLL